MFWQVHDQYFKLQADPRVNASVTSLLKPDELSKCIADNVEELVRQKNAWARALGVTATPSFFIGTIQAGGVRVTDTAVGLQSSAQLSRLLDRHLK